MAVIGYYQLYKWQEEVVNFECDNLFYDVLDKSTSPRKSLLDSLEALRPHDTFMTPELHMLASTIDGYLTTIYQIISKGAALKVLNQDLVVSPGDNIATFLEVLFGSKRRHISIQRASGGSASKGKGGRKKTISKEVEEGVWRDFCENGTDSKSLSLRFNISVASVNRIIRRRKEEAQL